MTRLPRTRLPLLSVLFVCACGEVALELPPVRFPDGEVPVASASGHGGAVHSVRRQSEARDELSRQEAVLRVVAQESSDDRVWVEVRRPSDPDDSAPIHAGAPNHQLGLAPGSYRVWVRHSVPPMIERVGWFDVSLMPAGATTATVALKGQDGVVHIRATSGTSDVSGRAEVRFRPARRAKGDVPAAEAKWSAWVPAAKAVAIPYGRFEAELRLRGRSDGVLKTFEVDGEDPVDLTFDLSKLASGVRLAVRTASGQDVTKEARVRWSRAGAPTQSGKAADRWELTPGRWTLTITGRVNPLVPLSGRQSVVLPPQDPDRPIPVDVAVQAGTVRLSVDDATGCEATWFGETGSAKFPVDERVLLPAGTWSAEVECHEGKRTVRGLQIRAGQHIERTLRLDL